MTAIFLQGNSRDVLRSLPENYVHCAVTSPPYFNLRKYAGGDTEIWDGDPNCQHEWGDTIPRVGSEYREDRGTYASAPVRLANAEVNKATSGNFCIKCGAWRGQLGGEPTPALYLSHLIEIMREVRRVLRSDGVFWLNIGDSCAGGKGRSGGASPERQAERFRDGDSLNRSCDQLTAPKTTRTLDDRAALRASGIKPLDMVLIPEQLAILARQDGWYVRSIVIWAKGVSCSDEFNGNPMPESVNGWRFERHRIKIGDNGRGRESWRNGSNETPQQDHDKDGNFLNSAVWQDCPGCEKCNPHNGYVLRKGSWRPTDSYEHILMLTKTDSYYADREAVLEHGVYPDGESRQGGDSHKSLDAGSRTTEGLHNKEWVGNGGRNLRSVWMFPTRSFSGAHFATFPPRLPELCIKSSTSERGVCPQCGSPYARIVDKGLTAHDGKTDCRYTDGMTANRLALLRQAARERGEEYTNLSRTIGWLPTCDCNAGDPIPATVLDPFSGAGTTALVCERLGLNSIGIDTSAEYIALAKSRLVEDEQKRVDEFIKQAKKDAKQDTHAESKVSVTT